MTICSQVKLQGFFTCTAFRLRFILETTICGKPMNVFWSSRSSFATYSLRVTLNESVSLAGLQLSGLLFWGVCVHDGVKRRRDCVHQMSGTWWSHHTIYQVLPFNFIKKEDKKQRNTDLCSPLSHLSPIPAHRSPVKSSFF